MDPCRVSELKTTEFTPTNKPEMNSRTFAVPKETEENETEDSNEEDVHIDGTTLIQWI